MMARFRLGEAPRSSDIGGNDLKRASSRLLCVLGSYELSLHVNFASTISGGGV